MAKLRCKGKDKDGKVCGCAFFEKMIVNEYFDSATNLTTGLREVEIDSDIKLYKCIRCSEVTLPPVDYYNTSDQDKETYMKLQGYLDGVEVEREIPTHLKYTEPGNVDFVKNSVAQGPENHGKFLRH